MKRNLMMAVLVTGLLLVGQFAVARASKTLPEHRAASHNAGQSPSQALRNQAILEDETDKVELGFALAPVPLRPSYGETRTLIGLGSYLVYTHGCNDCHTNPSYAPGGDPFQGQPEKVNATNYLAGGQQFGPFTSRNLTPEPAEGNLPAGLTFAQFLHTLRTGEIPDKLHPQFGPLLQVMPWPSFGKMTDRDLLAIYYYLTAIPHAEPGP